MKIAIPDYLGGKEYIEVDEDYRFVLEKCETAEAYMLNAAKSIQKAILLLTLTDEEVEAAIAKFKEVASEEELKHFDAYEKALMTPMPDSDAVKEAYRIIGNTKYGVE